MDRLLQEIRGCTACAEVLPHEPRPVVDGSPESRLVIIGQAPGRRVHESGVPWDDPSGDLLRRWLDVDRETFYDRKQIAIVPMGFCYPGKGKSGDLPPRPECAPLWHERLFAAMPKIRLTLLVGQYAQRQYLGDDAKRNLTETVRAYAEYSPKVIPLPHPSPRNRFWLKKNPWFDETLIPVLQERVADLLSKTH